MGTKEAVEQTRENILSNKSNYKIGSLIKKTDNNALHTFLSCFYRNQTPTDSMDMSLNKLQETVKAEAQQKHATIHGITKNLT